MTATTAAPPRRRLMPLLVAAIALMAPIPWLCPVALRSWQERRFEFRNLLRRGAPYPPAQEMILLHRVAHGDYTAATASFEHATRDDESLTLGDWDLLYGNATDDQLQVNTVVDDRSAIIDLGVGRLEDASIPDADHPDWIRHDSPTPAWARIDHLYVVHTRDTGTELLTAFEIIEMAERDRIRIRWRVLDARRLDAR